MKLSIPIETVRARVAHTASSGEASVQAITGVATLTAAVAGDLSFLSSGKRREALAGSAASVIIVPAGLALEPKPGQLFLEAENPSLELAKVCELAAAQLRPKPAPGIHSTAVIAADATIGEGAHIGAFVVIDEGARIGRGCVIEPHCRIARGSQLGEDCWLSASVAIESDTIIGKRVRIHAGSALGPDGFGYEFDAGRHRKVPQLGRVVVEDDVEIGACSTIDRGRLGPTTIGEGTKIDNQVQIGHNVTIGKHCILCSQVGIAGSATLGDYVVMGGKAGVTGHVTVGSGAQIAGGAQVFNGLEAKAKVGGAPAVSLMAYQRLALLQRRLPELFQRVKRLESELLEE